MNRIRKVGNKYQVLITPERQLSPDNDLMMGNWEDKNLKGFYIIEFNDRQDAYYKASDYNDIQWGRIVSMHMDFYKQIGTDIKNILDNHNLSYNMNKKISTPEQLKNNMFNRVMNNGKRFTLLNDFNDVVTITITNPWYSNLVDIEKILKTKKKLRIRKIITQDKIITLVGSTDLGTMYQIRLVPTMIEHVLEWNRKNNKVDKSSVEYIYKLQQVIDSNPILK